MPYTNDNLPIDQILCGNNLERIKELPDSCIQLVITSPPPFTQTTAARLRRRHGKWDACD